MKDTSPAPGTHPLIQKALQAAPIGDLIGFTLSEVADGRAVGFFEPGPQHANPMGTLQGGILCVLADATMGMALASTLEMEDSFTTLDLHIHFFRPVWKGRLRSEAHVIHRGRTTGYVECDVQDENGKQVAKASSKCLVLKGDAAKGR